MGKRYLSKNDMKTEKPRILVIDDDLATLDCIRLSLQNERDYIVSTENDPEQALQMIYENDFAAVISDVKMGKINGLDILKAVREYDGKIPVILITGNCEEETMRRSINLGVYEFLRKPFEIIELIITVRKALEANRLRIQNQDYKDKLQDLVMERTAELLKTKAMLESSYLNTIHAMVNAMEVNDIYTLGHSERVTAIAVGLGKAARLDINDLRELRIGALLHDLGKIGVTSNVLNKEQSLTDSEYDIIKRHPVAGAKIVEPIGLPKAVGMIILQHHEWYDGGGYPYGLRGSDIHPLARIVSVADSFDAMTSKRKYRSNLDFRSAVQEVYDKRSLQFDPELGRIFYENSDLVLSVLQNRIAIDDLLQEAY